MTQSATSLLPAGLYDLLPPKAAHERYVSGKLVEAFERFGYVQVSPPMLEFESSLLAGRGAAALSAQTYRVLDTESQQMMGFRPDITMQVGRIASVRLAGHSRPLRLSYSGSTLRVKGEGKERARQWRQAGVELIGTQSPQADAEVVAVAAHSIIALGGKELVIDINFPGLVRLVLEASEIPVGQYAQIENAVECKDAGWIRAAGLQGYAAMLDALMECAGDAGEGMQRLRALELPAAAQEQVRYVEAVITQLRAWQLPVEITIDPVENKGFEYHSLVSFSLFSRAAQSELARGGRYTIPTVDGSEEAATGVTLYVNTLMETVPVQEAAPRLLVSGTVPLEGCLAWQQQGFDTVRALDGVADATQARALGCSHVLVDDLPEAVPQSTLIKRNA